jgi:hypothetical protein
MTVEQMRYTFSDRRVSDAHPLVQYSIAPDCGILCFKFARKSNKRSECGASRTKDSHQVGTNLSLQACRIATGCGASTGLNY